MADINVLSICACTVNWRVFYDVTFWTRPWRCPTIRRAKYGRVDSRISSIFVQELVVKLSLDVWP